jgi:leader peptidase (prepilin peptidase)/N-methyltransferase
MTDADVPIVVVVIAGGVGFAIGPVLVVIATRLCRSEPTVGWRLRAVVALATAGAFVIVTTAIGLHPALLGYLVFVAAAIIVSVVDLAEKRIPNLVVLPASGGVFALLAASALLDGDWSPVLSAVIGAAALFGLYFVLALISPRGMGMGDVKLALLVGAVTGYLGLSSWLIGMLAGFVIGAVISLIGLFIGRVTRSTLIPFGPSMIAGALLAIALR